jgi:integrase
LRAHCGAPNSSRSPSTTSPSSPGVTLRLRRSKTNQEGAEETVAVVYGSDPVTCPVRTLRTWLDAAAIARGPIFREVLKRRIGTRKSYTLSWFVGEKPLTSQSVALVVKRLTQAAGVDGDFAGHSLHSGFATAAARAGKSEASIMRQTRHKSVVVARRYIRRAACDSLVRASAFRWAGR